MIQPPTGLWAVYYEDEDDQFDTFSGPLRELLEAKSDRGSLVRARTRAELAEWLEARPHVVFCDNEHLRAPNEGLHAIKEFKDNYPDTIFCLVSRLGIKIQVLGAYTPNPDLILYKGQLSVESYQRYAGERLRRLIRRSPFPKFEIAFDLKREGPLDARRKPLTERELHSIVEQVVDAEGVRSEADEFQAAHLEVIKGGFSGSGVYNLQVTRSHGRANIPAILKVSERRKAEEEYEHFLKFVKWRLPYAWRVDVLGIGYTGRFGAICYSPAMSGLSTPVAVNAWIRDGEFGVIDRVLQSVLKSENQTWYDERRVSRFDIREYFAGDLFYRTPARRQLLEEKFYEYLVESLEDSAADYIEAKDHIRIFNTRYPNIDRLVFNRDWGKVTECVSHGDLNGNNLLWSGGDAPVVFIDFQDTGFAHVFRDFVSFESSVRLEFPHDSRPGETELQLFERTLAAERRLARAGWSELAGADGYEVYAAKIRATAQANFTGEPMALYLVANIVHHMWLLEKSTNWAVHKRIRMAATILESTLALSELAKTPVPA